MLLAHIAILLISFYFIAIITDEYFLHSVDYISKKLRIHSGIAGATLMAAGSSAPELFIALIVVFWARGEHFGLGMGTIIGSGLFNLFVIVGISSLFNHAKLTWQAVMRDLFFYASSIALLILMLSDSVITLWESTILLGSYAFYVFAVFHWEKWFKYTYHDRLETQIPVRAIRRTKFFEFGIKVLQVIIPFKTQKKHYIRTFLISISLIGIFSYFLVMSAASISASFGISEAIVALTILAIGTSIPDLLSSISVSNEGRGDMAISNAIGSNVFNIFVGIGLPWFLMTVLWGTRVDMPINSGVFSGLILLLVAVLVILAVMVFNRWKISKNVGIGLIFMYVVFILYIIAKVTIENAHI